MLLKKQAWSIKRNTMSQIFFLFQWSWQLDSETFKHKGSNTLLWSGGVVSYVIITWCVWALLPVYRHPPTHFNILLFTTNSLLCYETIAWHQVFRQILINTRSIKINTFAWIENLVLLKFEWMKMFKNLSSSVLLIACYQNQLCINCIATR